jgi:hypothetical protein
MRHYLALFCTALTATQPALAAPAAQPATQAIPANSAIDPQRLALARQIVRAFIPDGTVQRMMAQVGGVRAGVMKDLFDKSPKDLGVKGAKAGEKSLGELIHEKDPYFEERMTITNRIMMEEVGKIMGDFEPQMRETIARIYAKRFTLQQLTDIAAFFGSPSGKVYGEQLMPLMSDPEYLSMMSSMTPKILQAMPRIMEKVKKATANLPPPRDEGDAKPAASPPS